MVFELTENYCPNSFPHRENQIQAIRNTFDSFKNFGYGQNLLILGVSGSGKTSVVKYILNDLENSRISLYVSASSHNSPRSIFGHLSCESKRSTSDMVYMLIDKLKVEKKIVIIDEVDKTKDMESLMNYLNVLYREVCVPIILITNKRNFIETMPDDVRLTLLLQKIDFPSYNSLQLKDILTSRLEELAKKNYPVLDEGVINYICAMSVFKYSSSARVVLDLSRKCILSNKIKYEECIEFLNNTINQMEEEEWSKFVNNLSHSEKRFLEVLIELLSENDYVDVSMIHEKMCDLTPSRISQLVTSFVDYGIIKTNYKNFGRVKGRFRVLSFSNPIIQGKMIELITPYLITDN